MPHVLETPSELPFTWAVTPLSGHLSTSHLPSPCYPFSSFTPELVRVWAQAGAGVRRTWAGDGLRQEHGPRATWTGSVWSPPGGTEQALPREAGSGDLKTTAGFNLGHGNAGGLLPRRRVPRAGSGPALKRRAGLRSPVHVQPEPPSMPAAARCCLWAPGGKEQWLRAREPNAAKPVLGTRPWDGDSQPCIQRPGRGSTAPGRRPFVGLTGGSPPACTPASPARRAPGSRRTQNPRAPSPTSGAGAGGRSTRARSSVPAGEGQAGQRPRARTHARRHERAHRPREHEHTDHVSTCTHAQPCQR